jgi:methyl-accepting chemotaxis protein
MKIGFRLVSVISMFNLIGIGLLAGITITLSEREISRLVDEQVTAVILQSGEKISKWFERYISAARTLAQIQGAYQDIPVGDRRNYFNLMLRQVIAANPALTSVYANWAPDALDGLDADYADTEGHDQTGRFIPSWTNSPAGPRLDPIVGKGWDQIVRLMADNPQGDFLVDPYIYPGPSGDTLIMNMGAAVQGAGGLTAVTGCAFELATIQEMVQQIKPFDGSHAVLFSSGGIVAAHTDPSRLGKNMQESEGPAFGPYLQTMLDAVSNGTRASFTYQPPFLNAPYLYYAMPFSIGLISRPWTLVVAVPRDSIMAPVSRMISICLFIGALTIVFMSAGVFLMARSISRPINRLAAMLKDLSEGEGDLTKTFTINTSDEIADVAHYFNLSIDKIKRLVLAIKDDAARLSTTGDALAANMVETAASIDEITAQIRSIDEHTGKQGDSVKSAARAMEQVVSHINTINEQIQKQSDCVSQSSTAVEQMVANIQSVSAGLGKNAGSMESLAKAAEVGRGGLEEVSEDIRKISSESEGLLEINILIENIASQTNLLSMNAAIEAAHAGDSGKGFAVVAEEVRKLAESAGEQSKTIGDILHNIKEAIDKISLSTSEVMQRFEAITQGVSTVTDQEKNVRAAMKEQEAGSKSILETIARLNEISDEVRRSAGGMQEGSRAVLQESTVLEQITEALGGGIDEMSNGVGQIDAAVNQINGISAENKEQIDLLLAEIHRFKVD